MGEDRHYLKDDAVIGNGRLRGPGRRPYVIAKFAVSLDGKMATRSGDSQWITGPQARARAHDLRQMVDAIIVGATTVVRDNPALTARPSTGAPAHPLRVVLDSTARTSVDAKVYAPDIEGGAMLATTDAAPVLKRELFSAQGVDVAVLPADASGRPRLDALLDALYARGAHSVMVEGGAGILGAFFAARLVDEVWAFIAPLIIGGAAPSPAGAAGACKLGEALRLSDTHAEILGADVLLRGRVAATTMETAACSLAS